mmetsp:Transcript_76951/g.135612  ORF Transcript_76951/g.135612 Transcript_76951/m.135612 type:complete len:204 (+) Transcript_76951:320-931(+)
MCEEVCFTRIQPRPQAPSRHASHFLCVHVWSFMPFSLDNRKSFASLGYTSAHANSRESSCHIVSWHLYVAGAVIGMLVLRPLASLLAPNVVVPRIDSMPSLHSSIALGLGHNTRPRHRQLLVFAEAAELMISNDDFQRPCQRMQSICIQVPQRTCSLIRHSKVQLSSCHGKEPSQFPWPLFPLVRCQASLIFHPKGRQYIARQ